MYVSLSLYTYICMCVYIYMCIYTVIIPTNNVPKGRTCTRGLLALQQPASASAVSNRACNLLLRVYGLGS